MTLSEQLTKQRQYLPDSRLMDIYASKAKEAEQLIRELVAITEDMSNGKDIGNRLTTAWSVADEILGPPFDSFNHPTIL